MSEPYIKVVQYQFEVRGVDLYLEPGHITAFVSEVAKNGQEDSHMTGELRNDGEEWTWYSGEASFVRQEGQDFADAVLAYVNQHGLPNSGGRWDDNDE